MAISPRKAEVDAVVTLLESDQFDTSTGMARELIKLVADMLSERDTLGVRLTFPDHSSPGLAVGPFYDKRSAQACLKDAQEVGMDALLARLSGTGSIRAAQALKRACVCGHKTEMHCFGVCAVARCACEGVAYNE